MGNYRTAVINKRKFGTDPYNNKLYYSDKFHYSSSIVRWQNIINIWVRRLESFFQITYVWDKKVVWIILCVSYRFSPSESENKFLFCVSQGHITFFYKAWVNDSKYIYEILIHQITLFVLYMVIFRFFFYLYLSVLTSWVKNRKKNT